MAFISEIHYKNSVANSTGITEYVEVSVHPDDLATISDIQIATYQSDGSLDAVYNLTDYTAVLDASTGWYVFQIEVATTDPNHTSGHNEAEAIALIDNSQANPVQSFVDIGGGTTAITAIGGPAAGETSVNITAAGSAQSIQFDYLGNRVDGAVTEGSSVICLANGTMIETQTGGRLVEELAPGCMIRTLDNGFQPLRMLHQRRLSGAELGANPKLRPVRIAAGALGGDRPQRDLFVSQQHKMLLTDPRFALHFGAAEALVAARHLCGLIDGVHLVSQPEALSYFHMVFDSHEVIFAEGAPTESFYPGAEALAALAPEARVELFTLFPGLRCGQMPQSPPIIWLRGWEVTAALS